MAVTMCDGHHTSDFKTNKNRQKTIESWCMMKNYDVIVTFERQMSLVYSLKVCVPFGVNCVMTIT